MKYIVLSLLMAISSDPRDIAKVNSLKKEAEKAYLSGNYEAAATNYRALDSLKVEDHALKLNLAHSLFHLKDTASARGAYQSATTVADKRLKSIAYQQLGVLDRQANKLEDALKNLKSSLKADPSNEGARYDYELVKKLLKEQQKQEQNQDQNQDQEQDQKKENQENQDQQNDNKEQDGEKSDEQKEQEKQEKESEQKDGEKEEGENEEGEEKEAEEDQKPTPEEQLKQKLEEMNMSEEKAQMILEALRNNEIQYLQQQKRKATKRPPSGKPDW
jgi:cobalamin biosynthesis protein CobT